MADPVAASGAASPFRAGTVLRPPRPSLLDAVAHSAVLRALAAWRDNGGGQPPLLLDGTAGNGHDCLFLARQAPAGSLLLALDIQEAALQASRARLEQAGMAARCCASAAAACALSPLPSGTTDIRLVLHSHAACRSCWTPCPKRTDNAPCWRASSISATCRARTSAAPPRRRAVWRPWMPCWSGWPRRAA